ncbi:MAG: Minf_1886 family protein [Planctomycetota bacterium]
MLDPNHPIAELLARDDRYPFDAYVFVFEALKHAQEKLGMGTEYLSEDFASEEEDEFGERANEPERHVSGQELCEAMRQYAHEQYGYLAKSVLNHWSIYSTSDFGEIVFNLIKIEQMRKTPNDRREDFDNVFDFDEGFQHNFQFSMPDSSEERRP